MSVEYYMYCRKVYDKIIQELDYIIEMFDEIDDFTFAENIIDEEHYNIINPEKNKIFFIERKKHIECLRKICCDKVFELCCHEMVRDELDVDPERSININYCIKCEYTETL